jgi:hypothetical protein
MLEEALRDQRPVVSRIVVYEPTSADHLSE